ncbi:MAG: hypothetical protein KGL35_20925 [Bradyrhizobium sp.]|nr:hypothetical protein [Bradyrhizobium sp.]
MPFLLWFLAVAAAALAVENGLTFAHAPGTPAQRLAACWSGSLTLFVGVWGAVASALTLGLDALGGVTGDPQFAAFADAVNAIVPARYHAWVPVAALGATLLARLRTRPPAP